MIGIIGYGMVGKAVEYGFLKTQCLISDPKYNNNSIADICLADPDAIFVCVPTPSDNSNYTLLRSVLDEIVAQNYNGLIVVKSTVLPEYIESYPNVLYNPEFLSRATSKQDFVNPPFVIIGGARAAELLKLYQRYSNVDTKKTFLTDIRTASLAKYTMNCFYAVKVTYMNHIYDVAQKMNVDYRELTSIVSQHPWMGTNHFQVPGPDGERGFGGPCLPKDLMAFYMHYENPLLFETLAANVLYRKEDLLNDH